MQPHPGQTPLRRIRDHLVREFQQNGEFMAGNYASGRKRGSGQNRVERYLALDVNQLHSAGCLCSGWEGSWQWSPGGQQIAAINLRLENDRLHLDYSWS